MNAPAKRFSLQRLLTSPTPAPAPEPVINRMPDPAPNPGDETPQGCEQRKDLCQEKCSERCCMLECWFNFELCKARLPPLGGGGGIGGIRI